MKGMIQARFQPMDRFLVQAKTPHESMTTMPKMTAMKAMTAMTTMTNESFISFKVSLRCSIVHSRDLAPYIFSPSSSSPCHDSLPLLVPIPTPFPPTIPLIPTNVPSLPSLPFPLSPSPFPFSPYQPPPIPSLHPISSSPPTISLALASIPSLP